MLRFIALRLLALIPILFIATFFVFVLIDLAPGDPAASIAGPNASPEQIEAVREELNLDDPLLVRYGRFVADAVQGDFGTSLVNGQPVWDAVMKRLPVTIGIVVPALLLAVAVAVPLGITAATHRNKLIDRLLTAGAVLAMSVPSFVLGIVLIITFALRRDWFPATGYTGPTEDFSEYLRSMLLPAIALAGLTAAEVTRQTRAAMIEQLDEDYVRTARSKGLPKRKTVLKHAAKNAAIPVVTVIGLNAAALLGGSVIVERTFAIPGFGSLVYESVLNRDIPVIMGIVVVAAVVVIVANIIVDLSYGYFSPKSRDQ
jgi:peptide/nickel transport system permease protein